MRSIVFMEVPPRRWMWGDFFFLGLLDRSYRQVRHVCSQNRMSHFIDAINLQTMRDIGVVAEYGHSESLLPHEKAALEMVAGEVRGGTILDIGVGGGRTVRPLRNISNDYLGIDYSPEMVAACKRRYPGVRFSLADARALTNTPDGSIALAVFSCNGISMVSHPDRLRILREVYRVLRPGGTFVFSTYNLNSPEATAGFRFPELSLSANPLRMLVRLGRFTVDTVISLVRRAQHIRHEVRMADYAMVNDRCHNYGVMLYYTTLTNQRCQLEAVGFTGDAVAFDCDGRRISSDTTLDSMALIARKA